MDSNYFRLEVLLYCHESHLLAVELDILLKTFCLHFYTSTKCMEFLLNVMCQMQALSSYVFIAANVILHASNANQSRHFNELLPPIIPLLTSHHHSLRGFTQVLRDA